MTTLEARVSALEQDMLVLLTAIQQISVTQTIYASFAAEQLVALTEKVQQLRDDLSDGDEWKL